MYARISEIYGVLHRKCKLCKMHVGKLIFRPSQEMLSSNLKQVAILHAISLFDWGSHTCGENGKLPIYVFGTYIFRIIIYIMPHLCAMQYFHIVCCSRDKISRTERLNCGNQRSRDLKTVEARLERQRPIVNFLLDTAAIGGAQCIYKDGD